ncbi:response regulator [Dysosmobacter sp.]|uniref:response regulator n=1 Tax=Dysosmobacter sp. TaxID=2591382 RepID=UPI003AF09B66
MELYRVLLVDDEEDIREGISRKMDWLGLGFSLVGEAANGQDALELAESLRPDVILTDIKMPFMDGLELCRILTDRLPAARFVVFSGFDAFEYAKQAIQMNVVEYILKPINADELSAVLRRLKDQMDRERAERRNVELLRSRYTENLPVLRELFYANLLDGHIEPGTERERAARLDIDLQGEEWAVGLAYIGSDRRDALSTLSIQNLLEETLTADRCKLSLYNDWVAVIVSLTESFTIYDLIRVLDRVCTLAASYLGLTLTVGVGAPCKELSGMARSAAEARTALEYRSMVGRGQVIYIGDLEPDGGQVLTFEEADERTLTAAVRLGSEQEVRDAAAALAGKIREANPSAGQYNLFLMELVTHLMKMTRRSGVGVEEVFGTGFSLPIQDSALPSLEELEDWCAERYLRLRTLIRRRQTDSAGQTVETAKEYIRQHYAESDLSVEKLCAYLHLSSTYFSTLFKRETGTSFTAYVTTVRMEAAAEAIRGTEEKTYLIAQRCGYEDPNYFSYVFKRHFGVTPTKYRSEGK